MRKLLIGLALASLSLPAWAALPVGARAPDFVTTGAIAGKPFRLHLAEQLRNGPVVLYFFPKAFTQGCTLEARAFSEASAEFSKLGARVIGMSRDDLATLQRFSVEECRGAFPVASASEATAKAYDVVLKQKARADRPHVLCDRARRPDRLRPLRHGLEQARARRRWPR
jgi:thioredoxin-dependent peroxiredoxin